MLHPNLNLKIFLQELFAFSVIGAISIFVAQKINALRIIYPTPAVTISWWQFLLAFGIGTAVVLGAIRILHGGRFLRIFFIFALFSGTLTTVNIFLPDIPSFILAALVTGLYLVWQYVWLHDLILILTLPGIAALIGLLLDPWAAVAILIIMSVYDYIAVYKTKHMVKMAKAMIAGRAIFAMIFPENLKNFKARIDEAHPGMGFMMLGTGDFVFPLIMAASAVTVAVKAAYIVFVFSLAGLLLMHLIFMNQKTRKPMPALPPLAAFAILGFLTALFLG